MGNEFDKENDVPSPNGNQAPAGHDDRRGHLTPLLRKKKKEKKRAPPEEKKKREHWLEFELKTVDGNALPFVGCEVHFADGKVVAQRSNEWGIVRIDGLPGTTTYNLRFPELSGIDEDDDAEPKIALQSVSEQFAPQVEDLLLQYTIQGLTKKKVLIEIASESHEKRWVYRRPLTHTEKTAGIHTLGDGGAAWKGAANVKDGAFAEGQFINPLCSPYSVRLYEEDGVSSEVRQFQVKYHSLSIGFGDWSEDGKSPTNAGSEQWVKYRLNELGYYAGPLQEDVEGALAKAVFAYCQNHPQLRREFTAPKVPTQEQRAEHSTITEALIDALRADQPVRIPLRSEAFEGEDQRSPIFVEALPYSEEDTNGDRSEMEEAFINRPLIPIDTAIFLESRAGEPVVAEAAVGNVRVNWRIVQEGGGSESASQVDENRATHPALLGLAYWPYYVEADKEKGCIFASACVDPLYPARLGKAGFYFDPGRVVGSSYRIEAALDFSDQRNADDLRALYEAEDLSVRTGVFELRPYDPNAATSDTGAEWSTRQLNYGDEARLCYAPVAGDPPLEDGASFTFRIYRNDAQNAADFVAEINDAQAQGGKVETVWDYDGGDKEVDEKEEVEEVDDVLGESETEQRKAENDPDRMIAGIDESEFEGKFAEFYFVLTNETGSKRSDLLTMTNWLDVQFLDDLGAPIANTPFVAELSDGSTIEGHTSKEGVVRLDGIPFGNASIDVDGLEFVDDEQEEDSEIVHYGGSEVFAEDEINDI